MEAHKGREILMSGRPDDLPDPVPKNRGKSIRAFKERRSDDLCLCPVFLERIFLMTL